MNNELPSTPTSGVPAGPGSYGLPQSGPPTAPIQPAPAPRAANSSNSQDHAVWAAKIDALIAETANNPRKRAEGLAQLKAQYLYEMFGVQLKVKE